MRRILFYIILIGVLGPGCEVKTENPDLSRFAVGQLQNFTFHEQPVPLGEIRFQDRDGVELSFSDLSGKVLLVNFWATWCGPCRREMPTLDSLAEKLGGEDFMLIALSTDRGGAEVAGKYLDDLGTPNLELYLDPKSRAMRQVAIYGLPTTLLLDRQGRELGRMSGPAEWDGEDAMRLLRHVIETSKE